MSEASERGQRYRDRAKEDVSDLIKRLRAYSGRSIHTEAADRIEELEGWNQGLNTVNEKLLDRAKRAEAQVDELKQARSIDVYNQGWNDALKALIQVVNKDKEAAINGEDDDI